MRSTDKRTGELFSYVDLEQRVRAGHPLRAIQSVMIGQSTQVEKKVYHRAQPWISGSSSRRAATPCASKKYDSPV